MPNLKDNIQSNLQCTNLHCTMRLNFLKNVMWLEFCKRRKDDVRLLLSNVRYLTSFRRLFDVYKIPATLAFKAKSGLSQNYIFFLCSSSLCSVTFIALKQKKGVCKKHESADKRYACTFVHIFVELQGLALLLNKRWNPRG